MVLAAIIACEIGFWVAIVAGLSFRYLLSKPRTGAILLALAPVIDAILLILVALDLHRGGTATWQHGLAALYIGISIAYGRRMVSWADAQFAHRFRGAPARPKLYGSAYTWACWRDVVRTALAMAIAAVILKLLIIWVGDPQRTSELEGFFPLLGMVFAIDLIWAVSYTLWPRTAPHSPQRRSEHAQTDRS